MSISPVSFAKQQSSYGHIHRFLNLENFLIKKYNVKKVQKRSIRNIPEQKILRLNRALQAGGNQFEGREKSKASNNSWRIRSNF